MRKTVAEITSFDSHVIRAPSRIYGQERTNSRGRRESPGRHGSRPSPAASTDSPGLRGPNRGSPIRSRMTR